MLTENMTLYGSMVPCLHHFPSSKCCSVTLYNISCTMALTSLETTVCLLGVEVAE